MARIVKTREELINYAKDLGIEIGNKSIQEIGQELIDKRMRNYDGYVEYIDNYHQYQDAVKRNDTIVKEVKAIKDTVYAVVNNYCVVEVPCDPMDHPFVVFVGTKEQCEKYASKYPVYEVYDYNDSVVRVEKVDDKTKTMVDEHLKVEKMLYDTYGKNTYTMLKEEEENMVVNNVAENNAINKEESIMVQATQVTKDDIREELKTYGIELSNTKFNRTKKNELIAMLEEAKINADVQADDEQQMENHEIMHGEVAQESLTEDIDMEYESKEEYIAPADYSTQPIVTPAPVAIAPVKASNEAKAKTDKLFALIKEKAADNDKKGFGYTISSFMLQAVILEAGTGLKKLKGHTVTAEEEKLTWDIYKWLKGKGFIKPVVYSVEEDEKVRIFMPEYPGKTENTTVKMIPYNKSAGYTAKKATSFLVTIPGAGK